MIVINKRHFGIVVLVWAGCFIIFMFAYMIALAPQKTSKERIEAQLLEARQAYEEAVKATEGENKALLNENIKNVQNRVEQFTVSFEDSANLTISIGKIAREMRLSSFTISPKDDFKTNATDENDRMGEKNIQITFKGGFDQFAGFLNALERNRPVLFVNTFKIIRSQQEDSSHRVDVGVTALVREKQDS